MKELKEKFVITALSYGYHYLSVRRMNDRNEERVLIVEAGVLGDGILFLNALKVLENYYSRQNKKIILLCRDSMESIFSDVSNSDQIEIISIKMHEKWPTINAFIKAIQQIQKYRITQSFVVMHHAWGHMINYCINSSKRYFLLYNDWYVGRKKILKHIINTNYNFIHYVEDDVFLPSAYQGLIYNVLGEKYKTQNPIIRLHEKKDIPFENYMILAPMANVSDRNLSRFQIKEIVRYILNNKDYNIIISGRKQDYKYVESIVSDFNNDRIMNYCGKTTLEEFKTLIVKALYLLGTDSGHIHLSSSLGTPTICLVGWWHVGQFLPYKYDISSKSDVNCVYSEDIYKCKNCQAKYGKEGNGKYNTDCYSRIKTHQNNLCLNEINLENVYYAINEMDNQLSE